MFCCILCSKPIAVKNYFQTIMKQFIPPVKGAQPGDIPATSSANMSTIVPLNSQPNISATVSRNIPPNLEPCKVSKKKGDSGKALKAKENQPPTKSPPVKSSKKVPHKVPAKPQSPFLMFYKSEKTKVKRDLKNSSAEEIELAVKQRWIDISEKEKAMLEDKYRQALEAYEIKVKLYEVKSKHVTKKEKKKVASKG